MTLVELLVVLTIIALLAALTMPVFRAGQVSVQRTSCLSNMHQIGIALSLYTEDYDRSYPTYKVDPASAAHSADFVYWHDHFCRGNRLQPGQVTWTSTLAPYVSSLTRDDTHSSEIFFCPADRDRQTRPVTSYEFKMLLAQGIREDEVVDPAATAMIWEQWSYHLDTQYSEHDRRAQMNILFVDGHGRFTRLSDATTALFGMAPNLHWLFVGKGNSEIYNGQDVFGN